VIRIESAWPHPGGAGNDRGRLTNGQMKLMSHDHHARIHLACHAAAVFQYFAALGRHPIRSVGERLRGYEGFPFARGAWSMCSVPDRSTWEATECSGS
jgi:hypothetical protein